MPRHRLAVELQFHRAFPFRRVDVGRGLRHAVQHDRRGGPDAGDVRLPMPQLTEKGIEAAVRSAVMIEEAVKTLL